ncbi:MAG: 5-(carboxyamino)imidazole ribonucleotide mutase [Spirochaetota bacterium]|nr:5-(carboxyamino)imidazole ribonucleotide mutase [Spirochaetota bacterium]
MPEVGIILGSDSDLPKIKRSFELLDEFSVSYEITISSAHRTPDRTKKWVESAEERGIRVIIAAAGGAAHLPGVVAAHTILPVIGIPIETKIAGGMDSILSILQMPSGIPVATMPSGKAGGENAALLAISILALINDQYNSKLIEFRRRMKQRINDKNDRLNSIGYREYLRDTEGGNERK